MLNQLSVIFHTSSSYGSFTIHIRGFTTNIIGAYNTHNGGLLYR